MNSGSGLLVISVVAVVVAAFALVFSIGTFNDLQVMLAPTVPGDVNVQISSNVDIEVTPTTINWGDGAVNPTSTFENPGLVPANPLITGAILDTVGAGRADGDAVGVNEFTVVGTEFIVRNRGNVNVNLTLKSNKNVDDWIGTGVPGSARNSSFYYNLTREGTTIPTYSCAPVNTIAAVSTWRVPVKDIAPTGFGEVICQKFLAPPSNDELYFDVMLFIDKNNPPTTGSQQAVLTFAATQSFVP